MWVFFTGGVILVIEVIALRLLSPYFGNTLYSVSSVLSVVLLALSAGYWFGGVMADKRPERALFYSIILASGLLLLVIEVFRTAILVRISSAFSITSGPLVASSILFIGPSFLLGMLSPFAIKLKTLEAKKVGIGRVTGGIFFWSTLGSIIGSLLAGFVLIPRFGSGMIMLSMGIVLVCMGLIPLLLNKLLSGKRLIAALLLTIVSFGLAAPAQRIHDPSVVYQSDGVYERLTVRTGNYQGRPAHFLEQDRSYSGAAYDESDELVYDYTKYYELYKLYRDSLDHALVLGGGAYSIPKALLHAPGSPQVDVSEIEPGLYDLAKQYFGLKDNVRLHNYVQDGRRYLRDSNQSYDLIFGDVYHSLLSIPTHFTTQEFFELAKSRLSDDGVFISNIIGDTYRTPESFTFSEMRTFQSVFPNSYFIAVNGAGQQDVQNIIMIGAKDGSKPMADFKQLNVMGGVFSGLEKKVLDPIRFNTDQYTLLTDDYAPVDYLVAKTIDRSEGHIVALGERAMAVITQQLSYGPRYSGSPGNIRTQDFLKAEMNATTDEVTVQSWEDGGSRYGNIIARIKPEIQRRIIIGTHFDSRRFADKDPVNPQGDFLGANDSASGVAVLSVVAEQLQRESTTWPYDFGIDLVYFDGEEGKPNVTEPWQPIGSKYFADHLAAMYGPSDPEAMVNIDMVCEKGALFVKDQSTRLASELADKLWVAGENLDKTMFSTTMSDLNIEDDHTALAKIGIPAIDLIDIDYPQYHTTKDTIEQCSPYTLGVVTGTLLQFLKSY